MTAKNFMSIGAVTQSINFEESDLVLVLGENMDLGGNASRNGVGKSAILNALSYALYGSAITNIKKNNLINLTNGKQMLVTLDFSVYDKTYRVERGRNPMRFSLYVNGTEVDNSDSDEAQGENRKTQEELERIIGISHIMFKNIVGLNTYSEPFLSMRAADQRDIIEHLLGITKLSEKATKLKEQIKFTKDQIKQEEFRIKGIIEANKRIEDNIKMLRLKSTNWEKKIKKDVEDTEQAIKVLRELDITKELENHKNLAKWSENNRTLKEKQRELKSLQKQLKQINTQIQDIEKQLQDTEEKSCPMCGSGLEDHKHEEIQNSLSELLEKNMATKENTSKEIEESEKQLDELSEIGDKPVVFYDNIEAAYKHQSSLHTLESDLSRLQKEQNPHKEQIQDLEENGLQEISYDLINELTNTQEHQEFLLRLLTNKDSFIRKKIIDQNLAHLNTRLKQYIETLNLPHDVVFQSDLSVDITEHGRNLDFHNLSRGERTRLILSLSLAFRDIYENLNMPINLLFIDELIDNGLDTSGVESSLSILKKLSRDSRKNVFLISHRDELVGRVDNVLRVIKSNGFTSFDSEVE